MEVTDDMITSTDGAAGAGARESERIFLDVAQFIRTYVVLSSAQLDAIALWVFHTHAFDAADVTPYLQIASAERRSGKSLLLEVVELLVAEPLLTSNISEAALFRSIDHSQPTLLLDEYDTIFGARARENEALRGLLNAGHRHGAVVLRCTGDGSNQRVERFPVFCAKALAGIGELPDTLADRSIPILLKRKAPDERVERFRRRDVEPIAGGLRERLAAAAKANLNALRQARPDLPLELNDRAADGWEPLLAIADLAGGAWPARARSSALELASVTTTERPSAGIELLSAIWRIRKTHDADRISTYDLIRELASDEESPFSDWWDERESRPAKGAARRLAGRLRPYEIQSHDLRIAGKSVKGYLWVDFHDAWRRHVPEDATYAASATKERVGARVIDGNTVSDVANVAHQETDGANADDGRALDAEFERLQKKFPDLFGSEQ
jgi:hypothetical protein